MTAMLGLESADSDAVEGAFSSPGTGEAESARSAEPGEGFGAVLSFHHPHPVASRLDLSRPGRGVSSIAAWPFSVRLWSGSMP